MKISENGINLIKKFEGVRLTAYKPVPTEKLYTIGYGHYGVAANAKITLEQAEQYLKQDLLKFENAVNDLKRPFNQNEFDALVSFTYNCGQKNLISLCRNRNNNQIAEALLLYNKAGNKILEGLTRRRKAERELFLTPFIIEQTVAPKEKLPYEVITNTDLNIRTGAGTNFPKIRTAKKGEKLKVWAIITNDKKWGKNGKEYYCLDYCTKVIT